MYRAESSNRVAKILGAEKDIEIEICIHSNYIEISLPGKKLISKLIEGNCPDYQVIPDDSKHKVMFNETIFSKNLPGFRY